MDDDRDGDSYEVLIPLRVNCLFGPRILIALGLIVLVLIPLRVNCLFGLRDREYDACWTEGLNPSQGQLPLRTSSPPPSPGGWTGLNPSQGQLPLRTVRQYSRPPPT